MAAKLRGATRRAVERALEQVEWAARFIAEPTTHVARSASMATTTLHYTREADDSVICTINKEIGSPLCGIESAIHELRALLADNQGGTR